MRPFLCVFYTWRGRSFFNEFSASGEHGLYFVPFWALCCVVKYDFVCPLEAIFVALLECRLLFEVTASRPRADVYHVSLTPWSVLKWNCVVNGQCGNDDYVSNSLMLMLMKWLYYKMTLTYCWWCLYLLFPSIKHGRAATELIQLWTNCIWFLYA